MGWFLLAIAVTVAVLVHRRFAWVPVPYLMAFIGVPATGWWIARRRAAAAVRWVGSIAAALVFVALCPVPWMLASTDDPPGNAWRLDGRMVINGVTVDPSGTWYWLTVGRPPLVGEIVRGWFDDGPEDAPTSMFAGRRAARPAYSEPAAAAVGLKRAGWPLTTHLVIEVSDPLDDLLPARAVLSRVNGVDLATRDDWQSILEHLSAVNTLTTSSGDSYEFRGTAMPFGRIDLIELPDDDLDIAVGGGLAGTLPGSWYRNLSLGSSHGLMVALVAYVHGSGHDLARGRAIAGTGQMHADGSIGSIGGLRAKATAARDLGADVLLFPAAQSIHLDDFDAGSMRLIPVESLDDAIAALAG